MYRYLGCGLDNIQLRNGYEFVTSASGLEVVAIQDVDGLHRVIAENICDKEGPLSAKEFRFLRKELDMSQRTVAQFVGVEEQTVSLWERDVTAINPASERLLRSLMKETLSGNPEIRGLLDKRCELEREVRRQQVLEFEVSPEWRLAA